MLVQDFARFLLATPHLLHSFVRFLKVYTNQKWRTPSPSSSEDNSPQKLPDSSATSCFIALNKLLNYTWQEFTMQGFFALFYESNYSVFKCYRQPFTNTVTCVSSVLVFHQKLFVFLWFLYKSHYFRVCFVHLTQLIEYE